MLKTAYQNDRYSNAGRKSDDVVATLEAVLLRLITTWPPNRTLLHLLASGASMSLTGTLPSPRTIWLIRESLRARDLADKLFIALPRQMESPGRRNGAGRA